MATILLTDGDQRSTLAATRSLGRAGHRVIVCAPARHSLAAASRHAAAEFVVPDALDGAPFAEALARIATDTSTEVLLPMTDAAAAAVLEQRALFGNTAVPFPSPDRFRAITDKQTVLDRAARFGIGVPKQIELLTPASLAAEDLSALRYPVVLKPARSVSDLAEGRRRLGVEYASDEARLRAMLGGYDPGAFPILLQERIAGPGVGIFALLWHDDVLATFAHRRIREKPPSGGVSVLRESIVADPALVARSLDLLRSFGWHGAAMVEYKIDEASGTPFLMEINGRFWGSLQLAIDAGVDFPVLLVDAALGNPRALREPYRTGIRSRWWWGDVDQLLVRMLRSRASLDLPAAAGGRVAALGEFLRPRRGTRNEVLRLDDPRPFLRESAAWLRNVAGR